jgi:hypothetical protein
MSARRRWYLPGLVVVASWLMASCGGTPPDKEIQQAQQAIDAARVAGADTYAKDEFAASQASLVRAKAAVEARDYRQALNDSLDARDRAQTAAKAAADARTLARTTADRLLHDTALSIIDLQNQVRLAGAARKPPRLLATARRTITDAERRVQEARTAFGNADFQKVLDLLTPISQRLAESSRALTGPAPAPRR